MEKNGQFYETTRYAGNAYGGRAEDILEGLKKNNIVMPMDICGAIALKRLVPNKTILVYIDRPMTDLLDAILARDCSNEEKRRRIISLSSEQKNEELCHTTIHNNGTVEKAVEQLVKIINQKFF